MKTEPDSQGRTSATLLGRLHRGGDPADWAAFVDRYGPQILLWCRRWRLQDADAQDVAQDVLTRLAARLRSFEYDGTRSFRAYLKTVTRYTLCDLLDARRKPGGGSGDSSVLELLESVEAGDDLEARVAEAFDREVLEEAIARVRLRVTERTWEAFRLTAFEKVSGADAAARLELTVAAVYKAKSQVAKLLGEEVRRLEECS
ncbi:MAG: sigma-70 family RNA polymerase sigma factor [Isosphaeraceae bacterium]|nr:sigma-70 family RNA polymerase sigma factor [Isosphaeraceae bacterium]